MLSTSDWPNAYNGSLLKMAVSTCDLVSKQLSLSVFMALINGRMQKEWLLSVSPKATHIHSKLSIQIFIYLDVLFTFYVWP
jgi:hypothetical protein